MHPPRRIAQVVAAGALLVLATATPAGADPSGPSDYRSEVTGLEPAVDGVTAKIVGGDSFLELEVAPGHEVVVLGYTGEPYLQVLEDGTIQRNRLSGATYLNEDRKAQVTVPAEVQAALEDPDTEPHWETIGVGGTYAWHDHRVHWMAAAPPAQVERGEQVPGAYDPWVVPIEVDGTPVEIRGTLTYEATISPVPWIALALVAAAALLGLTRGRNLAASTAALTVVAIAGVIVGRADWASTPDGAGNSLLWILPGVAAGLALAAVALARRGAAVVLALGGVAALSGWALLRIDVLLKPVLPTELDPSVDRATVALALAASVAAGWASVTGAAAALPSLDDGPDSSDRDD